MMCGGAARGCRMRVPWDPCRNQQLPAPSSPAPAQVVVDAPSLFMTLWATIK